MKPTLVIADLLMFKPGSHLPFTSITITDAYTIPAVQIDDEIIYNLLDSTIYPIYNEQENPWGYYACDVRPFLVDTSDKEALEELSYWNSELKRQLPQIESIRESRKAKQKFLK